MTREWKPGDVAIIWVPKSSAPGFNVTERGDVEIRAVRNASGGWTALADPDYFWDKRYSFHKREARPLVVIDPEDREHIECLSVALAAQPLAQNPNRENVRSALRSLVADPKPEEPTGLGAVVEDAEGVAYIRHPGTLAPWRRADATDSERPWRYWSGIAAVKVLSEGVQR